MQTQRIAAAIFDVDGTLVNSNDAHARAWVAAIEAHARSVEFAEVRRLIGMGGDKLLPRVCGIEAKSPLGKQIDADRAEIFKTQHLPRLRAFAQTRELFLRLRQSRVRIGIASSAKPAELSPLLELAGVSDLVEESTSAADAARSKPDPDIIHAALTRLELRPEQTLMIGDTPYDIEAAAQLGVATLAVRSGGWSNQDLHGALAIFEDVADLLARLEETPFGRA
jgi:HAD superfamily hydrolase (TIGR01509 family)